MRRHPAASLVEPAGPREHSGGPLARPSCAPILASFCRGLAASVFACPRPDAAEGSRLCVLQGRGVAVRLDPQGGRRAGRHRDLAPLQPRSATAVQALRPAALRGCTRGRLCAPARPLCGSPTRDGGRAAPGPGFRGPPGESRPLRSPRSRARLPSERSAARSGQPGRKRRRTGPRVPSGAARPASARQRPAAMEPDEPAEALAELRERRPGPLGLLQAAAGSGLVAYAAWALLLQPGFRRVPLRLQVRPGRWPGGRAAVRPGTERASRRFRSRARARARWSTCWRCCGAVRARRWT